jgi:hypothetical protein
MPVSVTNAVSAIHITRTNYGTLKYQCAVIIRFASVKQTQLKRVARRYVTCAGPTRWVKPYLSCNAVEAVFEPIDSVVGLCHLRGNYAPNGAKECRAHAVPNGVVVAHCFRWFDIPLSLHFFLFQCRCW